MLSSKHTQIINQEKGKEGKLYGELQLPFKYNYIDGWIYPPFISSLEPTRNFTIRPDDTFIATFPKNGTTWTQKIIQNLHKVHNTGHLQANNKVLVETIPWLENVDIRMIDELESPRYIKTHNPYHFVAYDPLVRCKYIYVARNPKDVCVSLFHHCKGFSVFHYDGSFEEFSQLFLEGKVESGDWWVHVKEYYQNSREMEILFLKYEDMHADGKTAIRQINDYCGLPELSDEQCSEVLELSTFKKMKEDPKSNYSWLDHVRKKSEAPFMRKGKVGDWSNYFSQQMSQKFDEKTLRMFADTDLDFCDKL